MPTQANPYVNLRNPTPAVATQQVQVWGNCIDACNRTLAHCIELGGNFARPNHIRALIDCAEACTTAWSFVGRGSPLASDLLATCVRATRTCQESCEKFATDATITWCADAARACNQQCVGAIASISN